MYLRHTTRKKDGKVHRYWSLVRSVRVGRRVIQQTVAHLGELDERGRLEARALARHLIGAPERAELFYDGSEHLRVPVRLKDIAIERSHRFGDVYLVLALWSCASDFCRSARNALRGRRWRPCWWRRGFASRRASCILPRTGTAGRRCAICCNSAMRRSPRIGSTAGLIISSPTRPRWRRICRNAAVSFSQSRTKCCFTMSPALILKARRKPIPKRSAATRAIIGPIASRS